MAIKTLYCFDLDDTLILSNSNVIVYNTATNKSIKLTPAEFAVYDEKLGDKFDFVEFDNLKDPKIIKKNFDMFSSILKKTSASPDSKTIILTARSPKIKSDVYQLLKQHSLPSLAIHAVGDSNPQAKVNTIQQYIDKGYERVRFWDDSPKNVIAVNQMKNQNPGVDINAKLIKAH